MGRITLSLRPIKRGLMLKEEKVWVGQSFALEEDEVGDIYHLKISAKLKFNVKIG